jgi:hypothetical protein
VRHRIPSRLEFGAGFQPETIIRTVVLLVSPEQYFQWSPSDRRLRIAILLRPRSAALARKMTGKPNGRFEADQYQRTRF